MRALLIVIALVVVAVLVGWITVRVNGNHQATVTVETEKIKEDTHQVIDKGSEVLDEAGQSLKEAAEHVREKNADHPVPQTNP